MQLLKATAPGCKLRGQISQTCRQEVAAVRASACKAPARRCVTVWVMHVDRKQLRGSVAGLGQRRVVQQAQIVAKPVNHGRHAGPCFTLPVAPPVGFAALPPAKLLTKLLVLRRQASEQYFTSSQTFSHFFRQVKGRPQCWHILLGRSALCRIRIQRAHLKIQSPSRNFGSPRVPASVRAKMGVRLKE